MRRIAELASSGAAQPGTVIYVLLIVGFGILVSLFPFHTWAPQAYASAPAPAAMLHAGVLKKFGLYGIFRLVMPVFPPNISAPLNTLLLILVLGNILYVGFVTISQRKLDLMLGYASVMHMGYLFLGILSWKTLGLAGAALMLVAHGLSIAALFALSGELRERTGTLDFAELGGLGQGDADVWAPFWFRGDGVGWPSGLCQFCRRANDILWGVFGRHSLEVGIQRVSGRDGRRGLGCRDLGNFHAPGLSADLHGSDRRQMEGSAGHRPAAEALCRRVDCASCGNRIFPADRPQLRHPRTHVAMISVPPFALEICVVCVGIFLLMMDCFTKVDKLSLGWAAISGLLAIIVLSFLTGPMPKSIIIPQDFYVVDQPALFFKRFILLSTILTICLAMDYAPVYERFIPSGGPQAGLGEFLILPIFTCAGLMWMVSAADFIMIFVSLELVTISFYVLVASMRKNTGSLEAGVKYLILGALSTGFIVYGITWIFGVTGQTALREIRLALPLLSQGYLVAVLFGLGLVLVSLGFKVAAVPFQFWVPDVYQGAPTPITAFLSVASKAAGFVVLLRVLEPFFVISSIEGQTSDCPHRARGIDTHLWQPCCDAADKSQTPAWLLEHRSCRLPSCRRGELSRRAFRSDHRILSRRVSAHDLPCFSCAAACRAGIRKR